MISEHSYIIADSSSLTRLNDNSVNLVVTSPPYPMISMWDTQLTENNSAAKKALLDGFGDKAWRLMHKDMSQIWNELYRVTSFGGIVCLNIGDAVRTSGESFCLYPNHVMLVNYLIDIGFQALPSIIWRKQTNAPNKFMGSGMLPGGAYVTLEHEFILIFRKGGKRIFNRNDSATRRSSAYFWEERNKWFSDIWTDLTGTRQATNDKAIRNRLASFPTELPYRLINMFSIKGDLVLDPFGGSGTTMISAMIAGRNSFTVEIDENFQEYVDKRLKNINSLADDLISKRLTDHLDFVDKRQKESKPLKYTNNNYGFKVVTSQETDLFINPFVSISKNSPDSYTIEHADKLE